MATLALPTIIPVPGTMQNINSPWQGQGLDVWQALVRNMSPFALLISVADDDGSDTVNGEIVTPDHSTWCLCDGLSPTTKTSLLLP